MRKIIFEFIIPSVSIVLILIVAFMLSSCVSAPKKQKDESQLCYDARYYAWVFRKNPAAASSMINGSASCRNTQIWDFCEQKTSKITGDIEKERAFQKCWEKSKSQ